MHDVVEHGLDWLHDTIQFRANKGQLATAFAVTVAGPQQLAGDGFEGFFDIGQEFLQGLPYFGFENLS